MGVYQKEIIWSILQWVVLVGAAFGAIYTILFKWNKLRQRALNIFDSMIGTKQLKADVQNIAAQLQKVSIQMNEIAFQFRPNGGQSFTDKINLLLTKQQLLASRQRALAFESMSPSFEADPSGKFTWMNRSFCLMVGKMPDELGGFGWVNIIAPEDRQHAIDLWENAVHEKRDFDETFKILGSDGHRVSATFKATRMIDDTGTVIGYFGTIFRQT